MDRPYGSFGTRGELDVKVTKKRYTTLPFVWNAMLDPSTPWPARFLARLLDDARRYGMPATRRPAPLWRALAATPSVTPVLAAAMRNAPKRVSHDDLDSLHASVVDAWTALAQRASRLPQEPPTMSILALRRSASTTVFMFADSATPLLVVKVPSGDDDRVAQEADALTSAQPTGIAPHYLGRVGKGYAQEGLPGRPYRLRPIDASNATSIPWEPHHITVAGALKDLATATATTEKPFEMTDGLVDAAAGSALIGERTRTSLRNAIAEIEAAPRSVLQHRDVNAQNSLFDGNVLSGIVDWEFARRNGMPGFDTLNVALSDMEHGIALKRWSPPLVAKIFAAAWSRSPLWEAARASSRDACVAAGLKADPKHVETFFFTYRFARRFHAGEASAWIAARMLETVCES